MMQKNTDKSKIITMLDKCFDTEFSYYDSTDAAEIINALVIKQQRFILKWAEKLGTVNSQLSFNFTYHLLESINELDNAWDESLIEDWANEIIQQYYQFGLGNALSIVRNLKKFEEQHRIKKTGCVFSDVCPVLSHFVHGLSGRKLKLEISERNYTDTESIFLPEKLAKVKNTKDNFLLYKAMVAFHWAQNRLGTFQQDIQATMARQKQPELFLTFFKMLDSVRIDDFLSKELPGLYQAINSLLNTQKTSLGWLTLTQEINFPSVTVKEILVYSEKHYLNLTPPETKPYYGIIKPESIKICQESRSIKEKAQFRRLLFDLLEENSEQEQEDLSNIFEIHSNNKQAQFNESLTNTPYPELKLDGESVAMSSQMKNLMTSIIQDFNQFPEEYLVPAGPGAYDPTRLKEQIKDPENVWKGTYHEEGAYIYDEWDYQSQQYRKNWCAVRELNVNPLYDDFVKNTQQKYSGYIKQLRRTFEALRDENRQLKRQSYGDGIDIDALVEAMADAYDGSEMTDRLFTRWHRVDRNIAVIFMVDMSGSTKGWINQAERESLILLAETLESLNDRYAIYGFSGWARKRCEIFKIKEFDEKFSQKVKAKISGITPQDFTRMGFAIRHLSKKLIDVEAKTRLLITLSDGKPDDSDNYTGEYAIEDTRRALIEARRAGVHPYCITIDTEAKDYLPHMYNHYSYTVIDNIKQLPLKVSDIYRRITS